MDERLLRYLAKQIFPQVSDKTRIVYLDKGTFFFRSVVAFTAIEDIRFVGGCRMDDGRVYGLGYGPMTDTLIYKEMPPS